MRNAQKTQREHQRERERERDRERERERGGKEFLRESVVYWYSI
jgi:hypothetical protein